MGTNMAGEHCPNCGEALDDGQIGLCEDCGGDRLETSDAPERGDLLSTEELSQMTTISMSSLTKWRCSGRGPKFVKMGQRVAYRRADVDEWLASNVVETHGSPELDADARKLEAMGQDAGPTLRVVRGGKPSNYNWLQFDRAGYVGHDDNLYGKVGTVLGKEALDRYVVSFDGEDFLTSCHRKELALPTDDFAAAGQKPEPTLTDLALAAFTPTDDELTPRVQKAILAFDHAMSIMVHLLAEHQQAWEGEEDSVKEEHAELIAKTEKLLALSKHWLGGDEA